MKPVYQTVNQQRRYTVMKPVYQTQRMERRYTVMKPVYQTVNQQRRYTVMKPVVQTTMVSQPYTVCRPVTTVRQVVEECGYYETPDATVSPARSSSGRCRCRSKTAAASRAGLFGCLHKKKAWATVAVQCPPRDGLPDGVRLAAGRPQRDRDPVRRARR